MGKTALVIGATGLVGEQCLKHLLVSTAYEKIMALSRKKPGIQNPKLESLLVDFDRLDNYKSQIKVDDVFCAIGTTIGKAGSQAAFRKADFEIPLQVAEMALANGAKKFILVSALGADAGSSIFYSRVKGELESALKKLEYNSLIILRPSLLLGVRKKKRTGEAIGRFLSEKLSFLFAGPLKKYKGVPADLVAKAMVKLGEENNKGVLVVENDKIFVVAGE